MIIGIAGASRSGKSTLSKLLALALKEYSCKIISLDDFALPIDEIPKINGEVDWEHPAGIDFDKLRQTINDAKSTYDIIIVEGFLLFYPITIFHLFHKTIFIDIDENTFIARKKLDKRWGKVTDEYAQHIWASFKKYGQPPKSIDYCISGKDQKTFSVEVEKILASDDFMTMI